MIAFSLGGSFGGAHGPIPVLRPKVIRIASVDPKTKRQTHAPAPGLVFYSGRVPYRHTPAAKIEINEKRQPWQRKAARHGA